MPLLNARLFGRTLRPTVFFSLLAMPARKLIIKRQATIFNIHLAFHLALLCKLFIYYKDKGYELFSVFDDYDDDDDDDNNNCGAR